MVVFGDQPAPSQSAAVPPQPVVTVPAPQPAGEPEPAKPEPVPVNRGPLEPIDETADAMASIHADGIVVKHDDIENTTRISLGGVAVGDGLWLMVNGMVDARTMFGMLMSRDGLVSIDRGFVTISGDRVDLLRANEVTDDTKAEDAVAATMGYLPMSVLDRICDSYKDATLRFRDSEGNEWTAVFDEAARIDIMRVREELRDLLSDE